MQTLTPSEPSAGVKDVYHIISIIITAVCCIILIVLVNSALLKRPGGGSISARAFSEFISTPAVSAFLSSEAAAAGLFAAFIMLMACNGIIYRRVVKKIFEHYSIVFTAAGGITLLFMLCFSSKTPAFICAGILLLTGAVLFLLYGIMYHKHG